MMWTGNFKNPKKINENRTFFNENIETDDSVFSENNDVFNEMDTVHTEPFIIEKEPENFQINDRFNRLEDMISRNTAILERILSSISPKSEPVNYVPFFIEKIYTTKENHCQRIDNEIDLCVNILTNYDEIPLIYPFGEHLISDLPAFKLNTSLTLRYRNHKSIEGEINGVLRKNKNSYVIQLDNNYAEVIQSFPAKITCKGQLS